MVARGLADLAAIRSYVGQFDAAAAVRLGDRLFDAGNSLNHFLNRGRLAADGCRALVKGRPYGILYEVDLDHVRILSIRHRAQLRDLV